MKINNKINTLLRIDKQLNQAFNFHQKRNLREAERLYREILLVKPDNDTVLYLLGLLASQAGQFETAINLLNKAIEISPAADYYRDFGDIMFDVGKKQEAGQIYRKALELNPDDAETSFNLALLSQELGNIDEAISCFENVVRINPKDSEAFNSLGVLVYNHKKDFINAEKCFNKAVELKPSFVDGYFNLGLVYTALNQNDKAVFNYNKAVKLNPKLSKAYFNMGLLFGNDFDKTIECYTKLIQLEPQNADAYYNLANAYRSKAGEALSLAKETNNNVDLEKAIKYYEKAIELNPDLAQAYNNLATIYNQKGLTEEAQAYFKKAIELNPDYYEACINFGDFCYNLGEFNDSKKYYSKALELKPDSANAIWSLGNIAILMRDFETGWKNYEQRFNMNNATKPQLPAVSQPRWTGKESLEEKTLLIYHEQGLGDTMQFIRYAYQLKNQTNAKILFKPQSDNLVKLLRQSNSGIEIIEPSTPDESVEFDYYVPLLSLPYILGAKFDNIPCTGKYLKADPVDVNYFKDNFCNNDKLKIGIVWNCQNRYNIHKIRSLQEIKYFYNIARLDGVQVYSLQKGPGEDQLNDLPEDINIINLGKNFKDFADTAAAVENMDIVLSVDTSVVHLSGALGKPTWVLLNYAQCWRWFLDTEHSPWYESVKVFKCKKMNDYDNLMKKVEEELKKLVEKE